MNDQSNGFHLPELDLGSDSQQAFFTLDLPAPPVNPTPAPTTAPDAAVQVEPLPQSPTQQNTVLPETPAQTQTALAEAPAPQAAVTNPIASAFEQMEAAETQAAQQSLFAKAPIFKFAGVTDPITDGDITFEELRQQKFSDFPEMEEKKTNWSVTYAGEPMIS